MNRRKKKQREDFMGIVLIWSLFLLYSVWCAWCAVATTGNKRLNERIKVENVPVLFRPNTAIKSWIETCVIRSLCSSKTSSDREMGDKKTAQKQHGSLFTPKFGSARFRNCFAKNTWIISNHFTKCCQASAVPYSRHFKLVPMKYDRSRFQISNTNTHTCIAAPKEKNGQNARNQTTICLFGGMIRDTFLSPAHSPSNIYVNYVKHRIKKKSIKTGVLCEDENIDIKNHFDCWDWEFLDLGCLVVFLCGCTFL